MAYLGWVFVPGLQTCCQLSQSLTELSAVLRANAFGWAQRRLWALFDSLQTNIPSSKNKNPFPPLLKESQDRSCWCDMLIMGQWNFCLCMKQFIFSFFPRDCQGEVLVREVKRKIGRNNPVCRDLRGVEVDMFDSVVGIVSSVKLTTPLQRDREVEWSCPTQLTFLEREKGRAQGPSSNIISYKRKVIFCKLFENRRSRNHGTRMRSNIIIFVFSLISSKTLHVTWSLQSLPFGQN